MTTGTNGAAGASGTGPSAGMAKRKKSNLSLDRKKSKRTEPLEKIKVGLSNNLTSREKKLLDNIVNLVTKEKENPVCTSSSSFLSEAGSALFMEYDRETEKLHLLLKSSTGPTVKFLVHPVYTIRAMAAFVKRPVISFSKNFVDYEDWIIIKSTFTEIFGEAANDGEDDPDFMFVFTRRGDFIHFRSYQVLDVLNPSTLEKKLKLTLCEHICLMQVSFPTIRVNQFKTSQTLQLFQNSVFIGSPSSSLGQLHSVVMKGSTIHFVLDDMIDLENWRDFSTCLTDFKIRNEPMFSGRLLGREGAMADYVNDRFKLVIRSLLVEMVGLHRSNRCFYNISESDICLSGTTVKLSWKLELIKYDTIGARYNYKAIKSLIADMFKGFALPRDLEVLLDLLDCDYLVPGDYLCSHCSLMSDISQSHLIADIFFEYTSNLRLSDKLVVAEVFTASYLNNWQNLIKSNKLLEDVAENMVCVTNVGEEANDQQNEGSLSGHDKVTPITKWGPRSRLDKVAELTKLITFLAHCNMDICDIVRRKKGNIQQREIIRIIKSVMPDIIYKLQHELRCIFGDKWFAKYFHQ